MTVTVRMVGPPSISRDDGQAADVRGFQSWALLARIVMADRPLSRRELSAELFPDTVDPLGSLRWCLAGLRRALGTSEVLTGDPVRAELPAGMEIDVHELLAGRFDPSNAGELLEGVEPRCGPELEIWLLVQRQRVAALIDAAIRTGVLRATAAGDHPRALELATIGARRSPLDEGAQVLLVAALSAAGHHEAALAAVDEVEARFRRELGTPPSSALANAARRVPVDQPAGVAPAALASSQLTAGLAALAAGAVDAGIESLRRASHQAERIGDGALRARCFLELGTALVHTSRGHDDEGALLLSRAADLAEQAGDAALGAAACRELGYVDTLAGRRPSADDQLARAAALAGDDGSLLAGIAGVRAWNTFDRGREVEGLDDFRSALDLARSAGGDRQLAWTLGLGGWAFLRHGDPDTAGEWLDECLDVVTGLGWLSFRPWPVAVRAEADLARGRPVDAVRPAIEEAFALSCQMTDPCWEGATARVLAIAASEAGSGDEALEWITTAQARSLRETDVYVALHAAILDTDTEISAGAGLPERTEHAARELLVLAGRTHMDTYVARASARLGLGV